MKRGIHPVYVDTTLTCACGATYEVGCTQANQKLDICSACHPYYTGQHKMLDREGRVERFKNRYAKAGAPNSGNKTN